MVRRGSALAKHGARVAWLTPRLEAYADVPGIDQDVTDANRGALDRLQAEMKRADLFGSTNAPMQRETVRRLLTELRGIHVPEARW